MGSFFWNYIFHPASHLNVFEVECYFTVFTVEGSFFTLPVVVPVLVFTQDEGLTGLALDLLKFTAAFVLCLWKQTQAMRTLLSVIIQTWREADATLVPVHCRDFYVAWHLSKVGKIHLTIQLRLKLLKETFEHREILCGTHYMKMNGNIKKKI